MNRDEYLKLFVHGDEVIIVNTGNSKNLRLHKSVYDLIKDKDIPEILKESEMYDKDDRSFFKALTDQIAESELFYFPVKSGIAKVTYVLTDSCNLHCTHCCQSARYLGESSQTNLAIKANLDILKKIIEYNPGHIIITGGEPLIVNNFVDVI